MARKYYEIVRIEESGPDGADYGILKRLVSRGWLRKAVAFLAQWDYGTDNIGTAEHLGRVWGTPTDPLEPTDRVLRTEGEYHLCETDPSRNGGYAAFYLTAPVPEDY